MSKLWHILAYSRCLISTTNLVRIIAVLKVSCEDVSWFLTYLKRTIYLCRELFHSKFPFELSFTHPCAEEFLQHYMMCEDLIALTYKSNLLCVYFSYFLAVI